jgi:ferritin-like metal-binding protein YciE
MLAFSPLLKRSSTTKSRAYGTLIAWAEELGLDDAVTLLEETLEEEKATDQALTEIAKTAINQQAEAA